MTDSNVVGTPPGKFPVTYIYMLEQQVDKLKQMEKEEKQQTYMSFIDVNLNDKTRTE